MANSLGKIVGSGGVLPALASGKFGDENRGFSLGLIPGMMYKRDRKDDKKKDMSPATTNTATDAQPGMKKGGMVKSSASKRADGCAVKGKTKGRMV